MKKSTQSNQVSIAYFVMLILIGILFAAAMLMFNQQYAASINLASLLSPTGARVTVLGFRIKHWLVGLLLIPLGAGMFLSGSKYPRIRDIGIPISSAGAFLIFDEPSDIWRTITTGEYP